MFSHHRLFPLLIVTLVSCTSEPAEVDPALVSQTSIELSVVNEISQHGTSVERLVGTDENFEAVEADGLVLNTRSNEGRTVLSAIRAQLSDSEYGIYLNDMAYGYGPDKVAIVPSADAYAYLGVVRTDGINYDVTHEAVLARYRSWDQSYGLSLVGAGQDWLEAELARAPVDWIDFANEVYEFCPDVVEQGAGTVEALANEMKRTNSVYLWWD